MRNTTIPVPQNTSDELLGRVKLRSDERLTNEEAVYRDNDLDHKTLRHTIFVHDILLLTPIARK